MSNSLQSFEAGEWYHVPAGVLKPAIDSVLPFAQIVEAHRRLDGGHKVGSVVLTFGQDD